MILKYRERVRIQDYAHRSDTRVEYLEGYINMGKVLFGNILGDSVRVRLHDDCYIEMDLAEWDRLMTLYK